MHARQQSLSGGASSYGAGLGNFARRTTIASTTSNFDDLAELAGSPAAKQKLHLLRAFDPKSPRGAGVPDPYYGGEDGFEQVLDICAAACSGLLERVKKEHGL
jgi:protein-tyrosine phosphatase